MIIINDNQRGDYFATSDSNLRGGLAGSVETSEDGEIQRQSSGRIHFLKHSQAELYDGFSEPGFQEARS